MDIFLDSLWYCRRIYSYYFLTGVENNKRIKYDLTLSALKYK